MTHQEIASGWKNYDSIDCSRTRKSLRFYKNKAHRKLRREFKKELTYLELA